MSGHIVLMKMAMGRFPAVDVAVMFAAGIDLSTTVTDAARFTYVYNAALFGSFFFVFHYVTLTIYAVTFLFDKVNKIKVI
ncbi:hypothetical protein [Bradyrhizobium barranii]